MMSRCAASTLLPQRVAAWRARLQAASAAAPSPVHRRRPSATAASSTAASPFPHPITFHPDFAINPIPDGHRFPMPKDALLHARLRAAGAERVFRPAAAERGDLLLCHAPAYVDGFLAGALPPKEMRRIGLPWSPELVRRTLAGVGSAVLAARLATQLGLAVTTNGGTHHAHPSHGSGFCVFNDLAVAARRAQRDGLARRAFFVDLDVHQGDGTAAIFRADPSAYAFSVHCRDQAFPEPFPGDMDVALPAGTGDGEYLAALGEALPRAWAEFVGRGGRGGGEGGGPTREEGGDGRSDYDDDAAVPVLALYNAGVDVHADDDLGKLSLTDAGVAARDRLVLDFFAARGVPLCAAIGGGYNLRDHAAIVERHVHLHLAAGEAFGRYAAAADARREAAAARRKVRRRALGGPAATTTAG